MGLTGAAAGALVLGPNAASAANPDELDITVDEMVEMRDGTELATDIYLPEEGAADRPTLVTRSPYGKGDGEHGTRLMRKR